MTGDRPGLGRGWAARQRRQRPDPRLAAGLLDRPANPARVGECPHSEIPAALATAAQAFGRYLEAERGRSAHTVRAYLADVGSLLEFAASEGVEDLAGLELGTLRRWLGSQSESGMSRATLARRSATARAFTAWAVREELIDADPALRLKAPKREKSLPGVLHQQQVLRLVEGTETAAAEGGPAAPAEPGHG